MLGAFFHCAAIVGNLSNKIRGRLIVLERMCGRVRRIRAGAAGSRHDVRDDGGRERVA